MRKQTAAAIDLRPQSLVGRLTAGDQAGFLRAASATEDYDLNNLRLSRPVITRSPALSDRYPNIRSDDTDSEVEKAMGESGGGGREIAPRDGLSPHPAAFLATHGTERQTAINYAPPRAQDLAAMITDLTEDCPLAPRLSKRRPEAVNVGEPRPGSLPLRDHRRDKTRATSLALLNFPEHGHEEDLRRTMPIKL